MLYSQPCVPTFKQPSKLVTIYKPNSFIKYGTNLAAPLYKPQFK